MVDHLHQARIRAVLRQLLGFDERQQHQQNLKLFLLLHSCPCLASCTHSSDTPYAAKDAQSDAFARLFSGDLEGLPGRQLRAHKQIGRRVQKGVLTVRKLAPLKKARLRKVHFSGTQ